MIDRLCTIIEEQAEIIREQSFLIENCLGLDDATKQKYADKSNESGKASKELIDRIFLSAGKGC